MLTCKEVTELVTDYLEGRLSFMDRLRFHFHVGMCGNCRAYLKQMKQSIRAVGKLPPGPIPPAVRDELVQRFRGWKRSKDVSWIQSVAPDQAEGELKELYGAIAAARGGVAYIHQAQSLNVRALRAHLDLYKAIVFQSSTLSRIARERIGVVVSAANTCGYCVAHHGEALRQLGDAAEIVEALVKGELPAALPEPDRILLAWAREAALRPAECAEASPRSLRDTGLDDRAILDAALTVAYFSFVNRIVFLLGVHLEDNYAEMSRYMVG